MGRPHFVIGPLARLPLTYVENCADCFAVAATHPAAAGRTFNVIDSDLPRAWRYAGEYLRRGGAGGFRVPVPYVVAMAGVRAVHATVQRAAGGRARLPGMTVPCRFEARFKPVRHSANDLERLLGWRPPVPFDEALRRTFR
jgi:UDP-glucose 4-epimerase